MWFCCCREEVVAEAGKDRAAASDGDRTPSCCGGKGRSHDERSAAVDGTSTNTSKGSQVASMFEFFKDSGKTSETSGRAMVGHCQTIEGGLQACVWVPQSRDEEQHKIVF